MFSNDQTVSLYSTASTSTFIKFVRQGYLQEKVLSRFHARSRLGDCCRAFTRVARTSKESGLALACVCIAYSYRHCFHPVRTKYATQLCLCHHTQIFVSILFSTCAPRTPHDYFCRHTGIFGFTLHPRCTHEKRYKTVSTVSQAKLVSNLFSTYCSTLCEK